MNTMTTATHLVTAEQERTPDLVGAVTAARDFAREALLERRRVLSDQAGSADWQVLDSVVGNVAFRDAQYRVYASAVAQAMSGNVVLYHSVRDSLRTLRGSLTTGTTTRDRFLDGQYRALVTLKNMLEQGTY